MRNKGDPKIEAWQTREKMVRDMVVELINLLILQSLVDH